MVIAFLNWRERQFMWTPVIQLQNALFLACYPGVHACVSKSLCQEVNTCLDVQIVLKGYYRKAEGLWTNYLKAERDWKDEGDVWPPMFPLVEPC